MTKLTPQQTIDKFVTTYTELYQDICKHSRQDRLPLTMWLLGQDFKSITNHQLETGSSNPFTKVKPLIEKNEPIAYVVGGTAVMVKRVLNAKEVKTTNLDIDSKFADEALLEEIGHDVKNTTIDEVMKDPDKMEVLLIASSVLNISSLKFGKPDIIKGSATDKLLMYNVTRKQQNKDYSHVTLELEADSVKNQIGNSSMINILGKKFGQKEK